MGLCANMCAQANVVGYGVQMTLHDHHLNIIRRFKGYNITFIVERAMQSTLDMLGVYMNFLISHLRKTTFKTASGGYLDDFQYFEGQNTLFYR